MSINPATLVRTNASFLKAATLASLIAGIPSGLLARVAMAVIAGAGGSSMMAQVGQLTVGGTLRIVIVPMVFGIPFAVLLLWLGRRAWWGRSAVVRSIAYAVAGLLIPGLLFFTDAEFKLSGPNQDIGPLAFAPAFLVYGLLVGRIGERLLATRPPARSSASDLAAPS